MPAERNEPQRLHQRSQSGQGSDYATQQPPMLRPPVPYQQFEYSFPGSFPEQLLPPPAEGPSTSSSELFSASEHTDLLGFLDQFEWQFDPLLPTGLPTFNPSGASVNPPPPIGPTIVSQPQSRPLPTSRATHTKRPSSSSSSLAGAVSSQILSTSLALHSSGGMPPFLSTVPQPSQTPFPPTTQNQLSALHPGVPPSAHNISPPPKIEPSDDPDRIADLNSGYYPFNTNVNEIFDPRHPDGSGARAVRTDSLLSNASLSTIDPSTSIESASWPHLPPESQSPSNIPDGPIPGGNLTATTRPQKPVLSTPEKRHRHIQSEQRRRNTIRDGYSLLTNMLAPHPLASGRSAGHSGGGNAKGRAKGATARPKGTRGRTRGKGKSGVLFRAVEYIRWLEESIEDLMAEVNKLESATGMKDVGSSQLTDPGSRHGLGGASLGRWPP